MSAVSWSSGITGILLAVLSVAAAAEVTLSTQVQRVVIIDSGGPGGMETLEAVTDVTAGDVIRYTISFQNTSAQDVSAGSVVITNPLPDGTVYMDGSAAGDRTRISYSVDGVTFGELHELVVTTPSGTRPAGPTDIRSIRWAYQPRLPAGESGDVSFDVQMR